MTKKPKIGIMQGRLSYPSNDSIQSFPVNSWREEFEKASKNQFHLIEWIFDESKNPILDDDEISEILSLSKKYQIQINSVCADYFMVRKLFREPKEEIFNNVQTLEKLIINCKKLGITMIEIPLVDSSSIKTDDDQKQLKQNIEKIIPSLEETGIYLLLETDLPPQKFQNLLTNIDHPKVCANYDSGNSASLGYNVNEELLILKSWIKNVHVKDRIFNGITVPFGSGDTDFESFFSSLSEINYLGDLIIQGSRIPEEKLTPEQTCSEYRQFVTEYLNKYYQ